MRALRSDILEPRILEVILEYALNRMQRLVKGGLVR
jgi:hypothetical protein